MEDLCHRGENYRKIIGISCRNSWWRQHISDLINFAGDNFLVFFVLPFHNCNVFKIRNQLMLDNKIIIMKILRFSSFEKAWCIYVFKFLSNSDPSLIQTKVFTLIRIIVT